MTYNFVYSSLLLHGDVPTPEAHWSPPVFSRGTLRRWPDPGTVANRGCSKQKPASDLQILSVALSIASWLQLMLGKMYLPCGRHTSDKGSGQL